MELEKAKPPRPPTFAFAAKLLEAAGAQLREVVISKLVDNVFYAEARVIRSGKTRIVDARPSDALNLAVLLGVPIRARTTVLDDAERCGADGAGPPLDPFAPSTIGAKEIAAEITAGQVGGPGEFR